MSYHLRSRPSKEPTLGIELVDSMIQKRSLSELLSSTKTTDQPDTSPADDVSQTDQEFLQEHFKLPPRQYRIFQTAPTSQKTSSLDAIVEDAIAIDPQKPIGLIACCFNEETTEDLPVLFTPKAHQKRKQKSKGRGRRPRKTEPNSELFSPGHDAARLLTILSGERPSPMTDGSPGDRNDISALALERDDSREKASLLLMLTNGDSPSFGSEDDTQGEGESPPSYTNSRKRRKESSLRRWKSDSVAVTKRPRSRGARALAKCRKGKATRGASDEPLRRSSSSRSRKAASPRTPRSTRGTELVRTLTSKQRARGLRQTIKLSSKLRDQKATEQAIRHISDDKPEESELFSALCSLTGAR